MNDAELVLLVGNCRIKPFDLDILQLDIAQTSFSHVPFSVLLSNFNMEFKFPGSPKLSIIIAFPIVFACFKIVDCIIKTKL